MLLNTVLHIRSMLLCIKIHYLSLSLSFLHFCRHYFAIVPSGSAVVRIGIGVDTECFKIFPVGPRPISWLSLTPFAGCPSDRNFPLIAH